MRKEKSISSLGLAISVMALLFTLQSAFAERTKISPKAEETVKKQQQDRADEKRKEIIQEAITALNETKAAMEALEKNETQKALNALEQATGKLKIILAREPKLELAPVKITIRTKDIQANFAEIKSRRAQAESLLLEGKLQDARELLNTLASEIIIKTINIPLGTYPDAMTSAAALIDKGDIEAAKKTLQSALDTLIVNKTIIPLPLLNAQALLQEAEKLSSKSNRSAAENNQLRQLLNSARTELNYAELLGYGTRKDFKNLYKELNGIDEKTRGGKFGHGFFEKIKQYLSEIVKPIQHNDKSNKQK